MDYELDIDPKVICRICLAENTLKTLFCNEIVNGSILPFPKVFENVTGCELVKDDGFPDKVCTGCRQTINDSYVLKQKFTNNQTLLSGILKIAITPPGVYNKHKITLAASTQTDPIKDALEVDASTQTHDNASDSKTLSTQTEYKTISILTQTQSVRTKFAHIQTECVPSIAIHTQTDTVNEFEHFPVILEKLPQETKGATVLPAKARLNLPVGLASSIKTNKTIDEDSEFLFVVDISDDDKAEHILSDDSPSLEIQRVESLVDELPAEYLIEDVDDDGTLASDQEVEFYQCGYCDQQFADESELDWHVASECEAYSDKPPPAKKRNYNRRNKAEMDALICKLCKYHSKNYVQFEEHQRMHKDTMGMLLDSVYYFRCGRCHSMFVTANDLQTHLDSIEKCEKIQTDEFCTEYQFLVEDYDRGSEDEQQDLTNHIDCLQRLCSVVKAEADNQLMCHWCMEFQAPTLMEIWTHFKQIHFNSESTHQDEVMARTIYCESFSTLHRCGYCSESFRWLRDAIPHVFLHAETFGCPFPNCNDYYLRFHLLSMHMQRKHLNEDKQTCEHCHIKCDSYYMLRTHMRSECKERKYACKQCDNKFYTNHNLVLHSKVHQNGRRFKCSYCDKRFTHNGDLKTHERIHTGDKPYPCPMCSQKFRSIGNRKDHMATHNDDVATRVECSVCGQSCKSERILRGHMAIHSTQKRFKCNVCDKEFYRKYHLTKHLITHK